MSQSTHSLKPCFADTGRFEEDNELLIYCNDEGVEYIETKVNADLDEFIHQGVPKNIELLNDLLPEMDHVPSSPLLGVQVNVINCGGLVIEIRMSHILADAFTFATFVKEWAHICQGTGTTKDCLPCFGQLPLLFPTRVLSGGQFSPPHNRAIITRRFLFDALAIAKLKDTIDSSAAFMSPTRVVVVMSLIWKVLAGISSAKNGHPRDSRLFFPINLRGKSYLPSLKHALGNFFVNVVATLEANESRKELNDFVRVVGGTIRDTSASIGKGNFNDVSSLVVNNHTKVGEKLGEVDKMDIYGCTSWCRFPWYEADFGWGKPFWVSSVSFDIAEIVCLMDTKNSDGIEVWVSLEENVMAEFEKHPDILTFCPPLQK
ncbi:putative acetyl-CoA-benzylalcohol acetyltransferase-like [Capsicum annuum]|nr:putative acetyl-CoA-benzylalcohol acetyltransferase-like [Capsicum annuum]